MSILPIRLYPDPVLRVCCPPVEDFDDDLRRLANDMIETMHAAPGIGLAAPQVGVQLRLAVVDLSVGAEPAALHVLVNPEILHEEGAETEEEGCLSIPDITDKMKRPARIRIRALDLEAEGLLARALCHEVDHLNGVLFIDRLVGLRKERVKRQIRKMSRRTEVRM